MQISLKRGGLHRLFVFSVAYMVGASACYWPLKLAPDLVSPESGLTVGTYVYLPDTQLVAQLLESDSAGLQTAVKDQIPNRQLQLTGVFSERHGGGYALISIDGKSSKSYKVGSNVYADLVLQSLNPRSAILSSGPGKPESMLLELKKR